MKRYYAIGLYETVHAPEPEKRGNMCAWLLIGGPYSLRWEASILAIRAAGKLTTEIDGRPWRNVQTHVVVGTELHAYGLDKVRVGCAQLAFPAGEV